MVLVLVIFMIRILVIAIYNSNFVHISQKLQIILLIPHLIINCAILIVKLVLDYQPIAPHATRITIHYPKIKSYIQNFVPRFAMKPV